QTFHFLLALLERDGHRASSQVRLTRVNNEDECELPAGFARLPRGFAIVLVGKSAAAMSTAGASAAITAGAVAFRPGFVDLEIAAERRPPPRSEEHTSELQSRGHLVCRLLLEKQ